MAMYLWIGLGGALGSMARYWCSGLVAQRIGETFPWGTLLVNVAGSFIIGFVATLTGPDGRMLAGSTTRQFVMTGILGGYIALARDGEWLRAGANIVLSVVLCLVAVWLGHLAASALNQMKGA
jgi:CrcB protein